MSLKLSVFNHILTYVDLWCPSATKQLTAARHSFSGCNNQDLDTLQQTPEESEYNILIIVTLHMKYFVADKCYSWVFPVKARHAWRIWTCNCKQDGSPVSTHLVSLYCRIWMCLSYACFLMLHQINALLVVFLRRDWLHCGVFFVRFWTSCPCCFQKFSGSKTITCPSDTVCSMCSWSNSWVTTGTDC